jgi:hypothetical protein
MTWVLFSECRLTWGRFIEMYSDGRWRVEEKGKRQLGKKPSI